MLSIGPNYESDTIKTHPFRICMYNKKGEQVTLWLADAPALEKLKKQIQAALWIHDSPSSNPLSSKEAFINALASIDDSKP